MASYVAGAAKYNTTFLTLTYNDKNSQYNVSYPFKQVNYPLTISKLIVITTRGTASASEDFINGLKPGLEVTTIGDTTNGKPVGMNGFLYKTAYVFFPITFNVVNSAGQGDFFKGFAPAKYVRDDITHDWNNRNEACLKEAIYYLENGAVSAKSLYLNQPSRTVVFPENPSKNNNAYIIK
jgi:hypothetical protein